MGLKANSESANLLNSDENADYGTLPEDSGKSTGDQKKYKESSSSFFLIKYANKSEIMLMVFGALFSVICGACYPILGLFFGGMTNIFVNQATQGLIPDSVVTAIVHNASETSVPVSINYNEFGKPLPSSNGNYAYEIVYVIKEIFVFNVGSQNSSVLSLPLTVSEFNKIMNHYTVIFLIIGTLILFCAFLQTMSWELASERQVFNLRKTYFLQIIRQEISWYDVNDGASLPNKLSDDLEIVRDGTGYKCGLIVQNVANFVLGIAVGLYVNVRLTLITLCICPFIIGLTAYSARFASSSAAREQEKYAAAGKIAEETLSNIKTVNAFCSQNEETKRYNINLEYGRKIAMDRYNIFAYCFALCYFLLYIAYAVAFWYGSVLVQMGLATPGSIFSVFFCVISGSQSIGQILPYLNATASAVGVVRSIEAIIKRHVRIDPYSKEGRKPLTVNGYIELKNVSFSYPSRPDVPILKNLNIEIQPGRTTAIVGSSGSGKSTIISLILRYYDPSSGQVLLDGIPVTSLNVHWLRSQIGLVSQEPVLFGVSIIENIKYGRYEITDEQVIEAAKQANAHDFIMNLPQGYATLVGDSGSRLSGGQKQRIAIARALVRNPKYLLLDEATSALDSRSEGIVQETLDKVMEGRTTVIIAHRLSTIRNADVIYVMKDGIVFESGTHDELYAKKSLYYNLVTAQTKLFDEGGDDDEESLADSASIATSDESTTISQKETNVDDIPGETDTEKTKTDEKPKKSTKDVTTDDTADKSGDESSSDDDSKHDVTPWKVLDHTESTEAVPDDDDEEYETIVTHVRETREILFDEDESENDSEDNDVKLKKRKVSEKSEDVHPTTIEKQKRTKRLLFPPNESIEKDITLMELIRLQVTKWPWFVITILACIGTGIIMPIFALYYGQIFAVFTMKPLEMRKETVFWTLMIVGLAVFTAIINFVQMKCITYASEILIKTMRLLVFENLLRQPVGWFDLENSSPGILVNRLAQNAPHIKSAAGLRACQFISCTITLLCAFIIAFVYGWKLALILIIWVPVIMYASYKQNLLLRVNQFRDSNLMDEAGRIASEAVRNIRTVQALGQEKLFGKIYTNKLEQPFKEARKYSLIYSILYSVTQGVSYYMFAVAFRAGAYFIEIGDMSASDVYKVFFALSFCAMAVGGTFSFMQDYAKARTSARLLNYLRTRRSEIDATSPYGLEPRINGTVEFKNVNFRYPARPDIKVLRDLSFKIEAGKTLALVGESGCGKSTVISLLERFYDPTSGEIVLDRYNIKTLRLSYLRENIGLVTQEPILFDTSIKDNIAYGSVGIRDYVTFDDIQNSAKMANIHNFIINLPQGYDTLVGERGVQLSGGQKQRVAIARALIRNPKILLLDEATSALDTENEKVVQEALDKAKSGRTCIVVAHRLSTIQNADLICVVYNGKIIEQGTHQELMELKGHYYQLTQRQVL